MKTIYRENNRKQVKRIRLKLLVHINKFSIYFLIRILPLSVQTVLIDLRSAIGVASSTRTIYFIQSRYAYVYAFTNAFHLNFRISQSNHGTTGVAKVKMKAEEFIQTRSFKRVVTRIDTKYR